MPFEPGDIVANKAGFVMAVGQRIGERWHCFYECNPAVGHLYEESELRFLSHGKGVGMGAHNATVFMERIRRQVEWAKNVKGLPPKYRTERSSKATPPAFNLKDLSKLSTTELESLLATLEGKK